MYSYEQRRVGIKLRQSYARIGPRFNRQAVLHAHAHARQYNRIHRVIRRQRTIVGRLPRGIGPMATPDQMAQRVETMHRARRLEEQKTKSKNKLYAAHAPEAESISKGNAAQPYEFGVKASFAVTPQKGPSLAPARSRVIPMKTIRSLSSLSRQRSARIRRWKPSWWIWVIAHEKLRALVSSTAASRSAWAAPKNGRPSAAER